MKRRGVVLGIALLALWGCGDDDDRGSVRPGGRDAGMRQDGGRADAGVDAGRDAGPVRPPVDAGRDAGDAAPDPDEDAGSSGCTASSCGHLTDACNVGVCDAESGECRAEPRADGTACGDRTLDDCTAPDTCRAGVCEPNHRAAGTVCGPELDCHVRDTCDGQGVCQDNGLATPGSPCGSQVDDDCSAPDTCNAQGACEPNHAAIDTPCTDLGQPLDTACNYDDRCDGEGQCVDQGIWTSGACPPGVEMNGDGYCVCGGPVAVDACRLGRDFCLAGACVPDHAPDGTHCGDAGNGPCDLQDTCLAGQCRVNFAPLGAACDARPDVPGDELVDTTCDRPDQCDGSGQCDARIADPNTECGEAPGECFQNPRCDGSGACAAAFPADPGTACGDPSDSECDDPDSCDGAGGCQENLASAVTACGDPPSGPCDAQDLCDGAGACEALFAEAGTVCADDGIACVNPDTCDGAGVCTDNGFANAGAPCGDGEASECDLADSCDGSGTCSPNHVAAGTVCGGPQDECMAEDTCDGSGACADRGTEIGCEIEVAGAVTDFGGNAIAGVTVELVGSDPPVTAVSDGEGAFTIALPAGLDLLLRAHPTDTHFGFVMVVRVEPGQDAIAPLTLIDDVTAAAVFFADDVAPIDPALGMIALSIADASGAGGESATLEPSCASTSCGPLVLDDMGQPVQSHALLPDGGNDLMFINLPAGARTLTLDGVDGVNGCAIDAAIASWPVFGHSITFVPAGCTPL